MGALSKEGRDFKKGDRVRHKIDKWRGTVVLVDTNATGPDGTVLCQVDERDVQRASQPRPFVHPGHLTKLGVIEQIGELDS